MDPLAKLMEYTRNIARSGAPDAVIAQQVGEVMDAFLAQTDWTFDDGAAPGQYAGRLLYEDAEQGFIAVAMAWAPGAETPIHDHGTWGVFGVLRGAVEFTNFSLLDDDGQVREAARFIGNPGDVTWIVAPEMEIHRLRNPGPSLARSLHIYGRNIGF